MRSKCKTVLRNMFLGKWIYIQINTADIRHKTGMPAGALTIHLKYRSSHKSYPKR